MAIGTRIYDLPFNTDPLSTHFVPTTDSLTTKKMPLSEVFVAASISGGGLSIDHITDVRLTELQFELIDSGNGIASVSLGEHGHGSFHHAGNVFPFGDPQALGATFIDMDATAAPADPDPGTISIFHNTVTGLFSVRTSEGRTCGIRDTPKVYKDSNQSVTSSTTPVNDSALSITLPASGIFEITARMPLTVTALSGIKVQLGGTANFTNLSVDILIYNNAVTPGLVAAGTVTGTGTPIQTTSAADLVQISGTVEVNTGGTLVIQWAQRVSNATAATVLRGAHLSGERF